LPATAFDCGLVDRLIAPVVDRWSAAWFENAKLALRPGLRLSDGSGQGWRISPAGLGVAASDEMFLHVAGLVLGEKLQGTRLNAADKRLVRDLATRCTEALGSDIAEAFGLPRTLGWMAGTPADLGEAWIAGIGCDAGGPAMSVAIASDVMVPALRAAAPPEAGPGPLSSLKIGLEAQEVVVSALIGRCQVRISDLKTLETGDIICLDARTDEPVSLAIAHVPGLAACRIEQEGEALRLRLVE